MLYALGYILKPGAEHAFTKAGLIYISTLPSGATVHIENKRFTEKTPAMIRGFLPRQYTAVVSLKGYKPWVRTISVETGKAAAFDKILLLPKEWRPEKLSSGEFDDLVPARNPRFLILTKGPLLEDMFFYDVEDKTLSPVAQDIPLFGRARLVSSSLEEGEGGNLLVHAQMGLWWGDEKFFWISPSQKTKIKDITHLFQEKPQQVDWDGRHPSYLFTWADGVLSRLDISSGAVYPEFMENVRGYGLRDKKLYVVDESTGFQKMDFEAKNREKMKEDTAWKEEFFSDKDLFKIKVLPGEKTLFIGSRGKLLSSGPPYLLAGEGVTGIEEDPQSQKILVWGDDKLGVLDLSDDIKNTKESRQKPGQIRWLIDKGKKISQAFWVYEGSHVLFRDGNKVYLLELNSGDAPQLINECFEVKRGSSILYFEKTGLVYYLKKDTGEFFSVELVPRAEGLFLKDRTKNDGF